MTTKRTKKMNPAKIVGRSDNEKLTSDLPSRESKKHGKKNKFIIPLIIIVAAGIAGFMIPTWNTKKRSDTGARFAPPPSVEQQEEEVHEPIVRTRLVEKEFAVVRSNEVGYLNIRAEASSSAELLGRFDIGDKAEIIGETETGWLQVRLEPQINNRDEAWISSLYVDRVTEEVEEEI